VHRENGDVRHFTRSSQGPQINFLHRPLAHDELRATTVEGGPLVELTETSQLEVSYASRMPSGNPMRQCGLSDVVEESKLDDFLNDLKREARGIRDSWVDRE
jgi:hypothetical protein